MAAGIYDSLKLEIDFGSGYVDVSTYLKDSDSYQITVDRGRPTPYEDLGPAEIVLYLTNSDGRFTPDNPTSPYWPAVKEGLPLRFSVSKASAGLASNRRFAGYVSALEPSTPGGVLGNSVVKVTATDLLGRLNNRTLASDIAEYAVHYAGTFASGPVDIFPLDDEDGLRNLGTQSPERGTVVQAASRDGSLSWSDIVEDGIATDAMVTFNPASQVGPVLMLPIQLGTIQDNVHILAKIKGDLPASSATIFQIYRSSGTRALDLRYTTAGLLEVSDDTGIANLTSFAIPVDSWFLLSVFRHATNPNLATIVYTSPTTRSALGESPVVGRSINVTNMKTLVVGGGMDPAVPGRNTHCAEMACGGAYAGLPPGMDLSYLYPSTTTVATRFAELVNYADNYNISPSTSTLGSASATIGRSLTARRSVGDLFAELARTVGGNVYVARDGTLTLELEDHARPTALTATITLEQDDVADSDVWVRSASTNPTRVTSTSTYSGDVTAIDTTAESSGAIRAASVETCAVSEAQALSAAQFVLNQADSLSLRSLDVELATAANLTTWNLCLLDVGQRIRIAGVPTSIYGRSYTEVYVQGWHEVWTDRTVTFTLETTPADVAEGRFDTARWAADSGAMTVTGGTAVGTTSTGTIIVTTSGSAPAITVAAGSYPIVFDWNGEWVTVTSAPASSVSPQTLTITARGVAPSVARVHATGETFDVANPGVWAI